MGGLNNNFNPFIRLQAFFTAEGAELRRVKSKPFIFHNFSTVSVTFYLSSIHPLRPLRLCVTSLFKLKIKNVSRQVAKTPRKPFFYRNYSAYPGGAALAAHF